MFRVSAIIIVCSILFLQGCAKPPVKELTDAETAVNKAIEVEAPALAQEAFEKANAKLSEGKVLIAKKKYKMAIPVLEECVTLANAAISQAGVALAEKKKNEQLESPLESVKKTTNEYVVVRGDCLWSIAGRQYNDPYQWPNIFKENRGKISNPDLIYPEQVFVLP